MTVTEEIRALAIERASADRIAEVAVREGMRRLREDGLEKVRQGRTSIAEVARVTVIGQLTSTTSVRHGLKNVAERPIRGAMNFDFADLLMDVVARRASDLHITAGAPPMVRVRGRLVGVEGYPAPDAHRHARDRLLDPQQRSAPAARDGLADRLRLLGPRPRALPRQRLLPALGASAPPSA